MAHRVRMDISNRAKQFAPFAALKGFEEALRLKERIVIPKVELTEEGIEEINRRLLNIEKNEIITVVYYSKNEYVQITGMVSKIDAYSKILQVVDTKIAFENIYKIEADKFGVD